MKDYIYQTFSLFLSVRVARSIRQTTPNTLETGIEMQPMDNAQNYLAIGETQASSADRSQLQPRQVQEGGRKHAPPSYIDVMNPVWEGQGFCPIEVSPRFIERTRANHGNS